MAGGEKRARGAGGEMRDTGGHESQKEKGLNVKRKIEKEDRRRERKEG